MLFSFMLSFQLAGGLILLLNGLKTSKQAIIKNCFPGTNVVERDDEDNCVIPKEKIQASACSVFLNNAAFADLVIGYGIAALSPVTQWSKMLTFAMVVILTTVMIGFEWYGIKRFSEAVYVEDEKVPYTQLKKNGVDTIMTLKEIDEICK